MWLKTITEEFGDSPIFSFINLSLHLHIDQDTRMGVLFDKNCQHLYPWKCRKNNNCWRCRIYLFAKRKSVESWLITVSRYFGLISSLCWLIFRGDFERRPSRADNKPVHAIVSVLKILYCEVKFYRHVTLPNECSALGCVNSDNDTTIQSGHFENLIGKCSDVSNIFYSRPTWKCSSTAKNPTTRTLI